MWMARLYPTYEPNTCLVSNGLSTMAFALPGAIAAKLAAPDRRVLAAVGDGAFLMNSQEIETAVRERIPLTVLIWQDDAYGLIKWKMNLEIGHDVATDFTNPDFVAYAESFGARGYRVRAADDLLPMLHRSPGRATPCRSSPARWTTRRTSASLPLGRSHRTVLSKGIEKFQCRCDLSPEVTDCHVHRAGARSPLNTNPKQ